MFTKEDIVALRLAQNGLLKPFKSSHDCLLNLVGIQSQVQRFGEVSIFNRVNPPLTLDHLENEYKQLAIVKIWGQRTTVHMYITEDWDTIANAFYDNLKYIKKNTKDNPEEFQKLLSIVENVGNQKGSLSRTEIVDLLKENAQHFKIDENGFMYTFFLQTTLNHSFYGYPENPHTKKFIHYSQLNKDKWHYLPEKHNEAMESILTRYFTHYGPATRADFCHWSGFTQKFIKPYFLNIENRLQSFHYNNRTYFFPKDSELKPNKDNDAVFLLGKFDPLFVSYKHKDWIATPEEEKEIWRSAAQVEAILLIGNQLSGTWRHEIKGKKITFNFTLFHKIKAVDKKKIQQKALQLAKFYEKELTDIKYKIS